MQELLEILEKNSRISVKDLAVMLEEDEAGIASQMTQLEKDKIIFGYHTMIDWDKAKIDRVTALIEVRVTPQRGEGFDYIAPRIYQFEEVTAVYLMSGAFDLTVIVEGKTMNCLLYTSWGRRAHGLLPRRNAWRSCRRQCYAR